MVFLDFELQTFKPYPNDIQFEDPNTLSDLHLSRVECLQVSSDGNDKGHAHLGSTWITKEVMDKYRSIDKKLRKELKDISL
jgi:hypothetical protein